MNRETFDERFSWYWKLAGAGILLLVMCIGGCATLSRITPGHVGIVVDLAGKDRGVQDYTARVGWVFADPLTTQIFEYPTAIQTIQWTRVVNEGNPTDESITFTTKEGMIVNADISLSYKLDPTKVPYFYVQFRSDDLSTFTTGFLHNTVRNAFNNVGGSYAVQDIMGAQQGNFLRLVQSEVTGQVMPYGVDVRQLGFIGAPRPPQEVINSINAAQQAQYIAQQKQNELLQSQADAKKQVAAAQGQADAMVAIANGEAQANRVRSASIDQNILAWRKLEVEQALINKWRGDGAVVPSVITGSNGGLLLDVPTGSK